MQLRTLTVDDSAWKAWVNYCESDPERDTYGLVLRLHDEHVMRSLGGEIFDCGLYLTDVPEQDLTVLELRSGDLSGLYLYSRSEAVAMAHCIMDRLGMDLPGIQ